MKKYLILLLLFFSFGADAQELLLLKCSGAVDTTTTPPEDTTVTVIDTLEIPNLVAWWKADEKVTQTGGVASMWTSIKYDYDFKTANGDASTSGYATFFQSAPGQQPLYVADAYRGHPALRFSNKSMWWEVVNENLAFATMPQVTVFLVMKNGTADDGNLLGTYNGSGWMLFGYDNTLYVNSGGSFLQTTPVVDSVKLITIILSPTGKKTYVNSVLVDSDNLNDWGGGVGLTIGRYSGTSTRGLTDYDVFEIVIGKKAYTDAERATIETPLKNKYGL